jgi:predicted Na+-dependent transporter
MIGMTELGVLIAFLFYAAGSLVIVVVIFAIWHVMKAHVRLAASMERMAESIAKIEETTRSRERERL